MKGAYSELYSRLEVQNRGVRKGGFGMALCFVERDALLVLVRVHRWCLKMSCNGSNNRFTAGLIEGAWHKTSAYIRN